MVHLFVPWRYDVQGGRGGMTMRQTELADPSGACVFVETRRLDKRTYETTITPGDAPDPDGPQAAVFATVTTVRASIAAHEQAIDFVADALNSTLRPPTV